MGFFGKIKQFLGIGGVKIQLIVDGQIPKPAGDSGEITGSVNITSKSSQKVLYLDFFLKEEYTTGTGDNKKTKEFDLGQCKINDKFEIKPGETKTLNFTLPFKLLKSSTQSLSEQKGVLGAIGKVGSFASGEKSSYKVKAEAKVEGTALGPSSQKDIKFV